jgi:hypothetical protein
VEQSERDWTRKLSTESDESIEAWMSDGDRAHIQAAARWDRAHAELLHARVVQGRIPADPPDQHGSGRAHLVGLPGGLSR